VDVSAPVGLASKGYGQGVTVADHDGDGDPDVYATRHGPNTPWRNDGGTFVDATTEAGVARGLRSLGAAFADLDLDGHLDLVATNGHIRREPGQLHPHEDPPILWHNDGQGRFTAANAGAGPYFASKRIGRGLAAGDLDGDGDLDLVHHHEPSVVLWNETPRRGRWLSVRLRGRAPNLDAIGARLVATVGPRRIVRTVDGGGGYLSSDDRRVHFGLGPADRVDALEVRWPSGQVEVRRDLPIDAAIDRAEED